ncbi:hypothetical protein B0T18DRAFT_321234, partial [Schizothecium vesticola]
RFAKISIMTGFENTVYERALDTHVQHALRHGYPIFIGRQSAINGIYNKIAYILNILLCELYKTPENRVEWLFYFDADTIVMNPEIPLEIFEPPPDFAHIHFMVTRDHNGLNAGVFFIRVSEWSLRLLLRVLTHKHYHPEEKHRWEEQTVLAQLTETDEGFRYRSIYVPKAWFNPYFYNPREVKPGLFMSHFPSKHRKWHMYRWLDLAAAPEQGASGSVRYRIPVSDTVYAKDIQRFWDLQRRVAKVLEGFDKDISRKADPIHFGLQYDDTATLATSYEKQLERLRKAARQKSDEMLVLERLINECQEVKCPFHSLVCW